VISNARQELSGRNRLASVPAAVALICLGALAGVARAGSVQFWTDEGPAFSTGTHSGTSLAADHRLELASPRRTVLEPTTEVFVWDLVADSKGTVYAATGNQGKLLRIRRDPETGTDVVDEFYDFTDPIVFSLAVDTNDHLYAATSPGGVVYRLIPEEGGKPRVSAFFDTEGQYVWQMVFGAGGRLYLATGPEGRLYRVDTEGKGTVMYESPDPHILSLALAADGTLYAGTSDRGLLYRIAPDGEVKVAYEVAQGDIHTMAIGPDGDLYFGTADLGREATPVEQTRAAQALVNELKRGQQGTQPTLLTPAAVKFPGEKVQATNAIYRLTASGDLFPIDQRKGRLVLSSTRAGDLIYVGTGNEGHLLTVNRAGQVVHVEPPAAEEVPTPPGPRQITALAAWPPQARRPRVYLGTANPGGIMVQEPGIGPEGTYTSQAHDAKLMARWGQLTVNGEVPPGASLRVRTRSGQTETPDETWSQWSQWQDVRPVSAGGTGVTIASPAARFLQYQLRLASSDSQANPSISQVKLAYLTANYPPKIAALSVGAPPRSGNGSREGGSRAQQASGQSSQGSSGPARPSSGTLPIYWQATDPNGDTLSFKLYFRGEGETLWKPIAKDLSGTNHTWRTDAVPDGTYYVKLTASDADSNAPTRAQTTQEVSPPFIVDNTPPVITDLLCKPTGDNFKLTASVKDAASALTALTYSIDAEKWVSVGPVDGILDERLEEVAVDLGKLEPGEHTITLKATDSRGNTTAAKEVLTVPGAPAE